MRHLHAFFGSNTLIQREPLLNKAGAFLPHPRCIVETIPSTFTERLLEFLSTQFPLHGMGWPGRRYIHLPSESQHRVGIKPQPPGRKSRLIPTTLPLTTRLILHQIKFSVTIFNFIASVSPKGEPRSFLVVSMMMTELFSEEA